MSLPSSLVSNFTLNHNLEKAFKNSYSVIKIFEKYCLIIFVVAESKFTLQNNGHILIHTDIYIKIAFIIINITILYLHTNRLKN